MSFILLIFSTAFSMEAIGTYISVYGLGSLFANDPVILVMAVILDIAKIVTVSFVYQYWHQVKSVMKYYMLSSVLILMTITSSGAFGYLSGAFQKAIQPGMEVSLKVDSFKREQTSLLLERDQLSKQRSDIDKQIAQLPIEYVKGRQKLIASFKPESDRISSRLSIITKRNDALTENILKVESENIDKEVHVGPIMYIAKAFDVPVEQASKWIILTIIFVFDPLAIILIIAGNFLVARRKNEKLSIQESIEIKPVIQPDETESIQESVEINPTTEPDIETINLSEKSEDQLSKEIIETNVNSQKRKLYELSNIEQDSLKKALFNSVKVINVEKEDLSDNIEIDTEILKNLVKNYIPSSVDDIILDNTETIIEPLMKSSLESLQVNMPEVLFRQNTNVNSQKRKLYE